MNNAITLITDKPYASRCILPRARLRWPHEIIYAIPTLYVGRYALKYPRGLRYADLPFVADPSWQERDDITAPILYMPADSTEIMVCRQTALREQDAVAALLEGSEIVYAGDPSHSGAVGYHVLLEKALGEDAARLSRLCVSPSAFDDASIDAAMRSGESTSGQRFQQWLNAGIARRYFDFNFNVNAQFLLRAVLRLLHAQHSDFGVSKFGLQTLYRGRVLGPIREDRLLEAMSNWRGAGGRSEATTMLGSPASQGAIVAQLRALNLLEELEGSGGVKYLRVSSLGEAFLSELHPDCEDADLPFRLERWSAEWPASQANIDRYLRTFFGKQKRYAQHRFGSTQGGASESGFVRSP